MVESADARVLKTLLGNEVRVQISPVAPRAIVQLPESPYLGWTRYPLLGLLKVSCIINIVSNLLYAGMSEWFMELVLKTSKEESFEGSNPSARAIMFILLFNY